MTALAPSTDAREIRCPRCGYDQRGVLSTWHESCPMQGTCTECGLTFNWCEVLQPEKFEPRWCIEYEPKRRWLPWAAVRTFVRSFRPWWFWSRLKMSDGIRWPRLILYVAIMLLVPALTVYVPTQVWLATYARSQVQSQLVQAAAQRASTIKSLQSYAAQMAAVPLTGDTLQDQAMQAQVASINGEIARQQALGTTQERIDSSWLYTTWEALSAPLASRSGATIVSTAGGQAWPYIPPRDLWQIVSMWTGWGGSGGGWGLGMSRGAADGFVLPLAWLAWGLAMTLLLPMSFVLMPLSMRKAKVRWAHVVRVTIYSLFIPLICAWLTAATLAATIVSTDDLTLAIYASAIRYGPWLALALWWTAATGRYLKIPHAWLTIGLLTLMCLLGLLGITAAISTELAWEMMGLFDLLYD